MDNPNFTPGQRLLTTTAWVLIVANTLSLAVFYSERTNGSAVSVAARRPTRTPQGASADWQQLTPEWMGKVPPGLRFSPPVGGLSIALQEPSKTPASRLDHTFFSVWLLNSGYKTVAFSRHPALLRLAVYDSKGRLVTDLEHYGNNQDWEHPGLWDLVILGSGEMIRTETIPVSLNRKQVHRGAYQVEAILEGPPPDWWFNLRRPWSIPEELQRDGMAVWGPAKNVSPRQLLELE
jgi:hypothetical protein